MATGGLGALLAALSASAMAQAPQIQYSVLEHIAGPGAGWDYISLEAGAPKLLQILATRKSARLGALDPGKGKVYLPAGKLGPPVPPDPWPTVVPGSFEILVVGRK